MDDTEKLLYENYISFSDKRSSLFRKYMLGLILPTLAGIITFTSNTVISDTKFLNINVNILFAAFWSVAALGLFFLKLTMNYVVKSHAIIEKKIYKSLVEKDYKSVWNIKEYSMVNNCLTYAAVIIMLVSALMFIQRDLILVRILLLIAAGLIVWSLILTFGKQGEQT